jgi:hypothetical protein
VSRVGQGSAGALWPVRDSSLIVRAMFSSSSSPAIGDLVRFDSVLSSRLFFTFLLLASITVFAGCDDVCDRMCDAQADLMEKCFPTWESSWEEQSYRSREAFIGRCYTVWGDASEDLESGSTEAQEFQERCRVQFEIALADSDCESVLQIDP